MRQCAALAVLALLLGCAAPQRAVRDGDTTRAIANSFETQADGAVCQVAADGGPVTHPGSLSTPSQPREQRQADRGIGGTGTVPTDVRPGSKQLAERGIGGTGIVGVITGFASICVDGLEVAYDPSTPLDIDGVAGPPSALRAGEIVVIQARGSAVAPFAQAISVRRQVIGQIESIEPSTGTLTIAGQAVAVPAGIWGAEMGRLGGWVAVSGLRRNDGMLTATRLDMAPVGTMMVRGPVVREGDTVRIGDLVLNAAAARDLAAGEYVVVSGQYAGGRVQVRAVAQDPLYGDPASSFGAAVNRLVLQAFVRVANGVVYLDGLKFPAGPGISSKSAADVLAIVSLERRADGSFTAVNLHSIGGGKSSPGSSSAPAAISRGSTTTWPQARRPAAEMMALAGNGSGPTGPATAQASDGTGSAAAIKSTKADALARSTIVADAPPASAHETRSAEVDAHLGNAADRGLNALTEDLDPEREPAVMVAPPAVRVPPPPAGLEGSIESDPAATSPLISSLPGPANALKPATPRAVALHATKPRTSSASTTVSLATEAVTAPTMPATRAGASARPAPPTSSSAAVDPSDKRLRTGKTGFNRSAIDPGCQPDITRSSCPARAKMIAVPH